MITKSNLPELREIYTLHTWAKGNITRTTKKFCSDNDTPYNDSKRRKVSKLFEKHGVIIEESRESPAKILIYDIETAPLKSYIWSLWNQNVGHTPQMLIQNEWFVITWSAKWLFEDKIMSDKITSSEIVVENDLRIVKSLWDLMNEADIVIAHNALKFDNKHMNTRFLKYDMGPPMPYQTIDTLAHARKQFKLPSNKLDSIATFFGIEGKMETGGFELWRQCIEGSSEAIDKMEEYNIKDVQILEEIYLKMRPFIRPHPNMNLHIGKDVQACPACGSEHITFDGAYQTYCNTYDAYRCNDCKSIGRSKKANKINKEKFLNSVPN